MEHTTPAMVGPHGTPSRAELFALTDEQILEIQPDLSGAFQDGQSASADGHDLARNSSSLTEHGSRHTDHVPQVAQTILSAPGVNSPSHDPAQAGVPVLPEPPPWLAAQMNDPNSGAEARDLWNGIQQARNEAAAYREVFAKPEEARAAADRARALEEIDSAFFGGAGKSAGEITAGRAALAQRMLREDPAAFREMVFAGLRALESAAQLSAANPNSAIRSEQSAPRYLSSGTAPANQASGAPVAEHGSRNTEHDSQLAAYNAFEKSANEDLERSVGSAIQHSLQQALPNLGKGGNPTVAGARSRSFGTVPLESRLAAAVRDDVESALKSDQQLGEQLARVLSARRFDETTRSQVVRLINDRAQQLVPGAARRVIQEWTQTTLAAYRNTSSSAAPGEDFGVAGNRADAASPRSLAQSSASSRGATTRAPALSTKSAAADRAERDVALTPRTTSRPNGRAVDYNRLSDEQILDL